MHAYCKMHSNANLHVFFLIIDKDATINQKCLCSGQEHGNALPHSDAHGA